MAEEEIVTEGQETAAIQTPIEDLFGPPDTSQTSAANNQEGVTPLSPDMSVKDVKTEVSQQEGEKGADVGNLEVGKQESKTITIEEANTLWEKRFKDSRDWSFRVQSENEGMKRTLEEQGKYIDKMNKQLNGDWTDEDEQTFTAVRPEPTTEDIAMYANEQGRIAASEIAAMEIYGKDKVNQMLYAPDAPFRELLNDPFVVAKIRGADAPAIEAIKIVESKQFFDKWGYNPIDIERNMYKAVETTLTEKLTKQILGKLQGKDNDAAGLRDIRSTGASEHPFTQASVETLFAH